MSKRPGSATTAERSSLTQTTTPLGAADVVTGQHASIDIPHFRAELTATYTDVALDTATFATVPEARPATACRRAPGSTVPGMNGTQIGLIGAGEMGSGIGGPPRGARRRRPYDAAGRSAASAERVRTRRIGRRRRSRGDRAQLRAGALDRAAGSRARRRRAFAGGLAPGGRRAPLYVDCNAVAPETTRAIGAVDRRPPACASSTRGSSAGAARGIRRAAHLRLRRRTSRNSRRSPRYGLEVGRWTARSVPRRR